jgi:hypothetical protein
VELTADNYHSAESNRHYLSVSQFKEFAFDCEARALARLNGEYTPPDEKALLLGQYLHAWNEGTLDQFVEAGKKDIFKKTGDKGKYEDYIKADAAIACLETDPLAMKALAGDREVIFTGEIDGVPWKCKVDSLGAVRFADLKYVKDFQSFYSPEKGARVSWIEHWGYHYQMAVYQEIIRQNTAEVMEPLIVAVTKETPPDKGIFGGFAQYEMNAILERVRLLQERIVAVKNGEELPEACGKCDYCRSVKVLNEVRRWDEVF